MGLFNTFSSTGTSLNYDFFSGNALRQNIPILDNLFGTKLTTGDIDVPIDLNIPVDASKKSTTSTYAPSTQSSFQYSPTDARSVAIITGSPSASITKKDSIAGASQVPSQTPSFYFPTDFGQTSVPVTPTITPSLSLPAGGSFNDVLLIGGLVAGGYLIFKGFSSKKKNKKK